MLSRLHIENVAVIEEADLDFSQGFHVLTGETGAGKSIIIDAINAVLGERTPRGLVRAGAEKAAITALFEDVGDAVCAKAEKLGYEAEDGALLLQRTVGADGKGAFRIGGRPATASVLRELGRMLVNIHGQHDSQALLNPERHMGYVDALAGNEALRRSYQNAYHAWRDLLRERDALQMDESEKARRRDLLEYQVHELEEAGLRPGEREELAARRALYRNSERVAQSVGEAYARLQGVEDTPGAVSLAQEAARALQDAAAYFSPAAELHERVLGLSYDLEAAAEELSGLLDGAEYDPRELDAIEQRLDLLYRLSRKYGETEEEMLAFLDSAAQELARIENSDERLREIEKELAAAQTRAEAAAQALSRSRRDAGARFAEQVREELAFLDMPGVKFLVRQEKIPLSADGADQIEFLISANPGEPPGPLSKIASGGELSRIMLAIKSVLADKDEVQTLIFDEVDTGVSGRAAQKVGVKLRETSHHRQVVCVTHLAQIAALAERHFKIEKQVRGGRTYTQVTPLDDAGRIDEVARIMAGGEITDTMRRSAEELIRAGERLG